MYLGVYDDEDLAEDGLFLLMCPQPPHYIWIGPHFHHLHEMQGLEQGSGTGQRQESNRNNSLIPFSSTRNRGNDTETSDSERELGGEENGEEREKEEGSRISDQSVVSWTCRHVLRGSPPTPTTISPSISYYTQLLDLLY